MTHWHETSKRNLAPLSQASSFKEALKEWKFTGLVLDCNDKNIKCELCEHPNLSCHFEIQNTLNANRLLVGSNCILKFSEINIYDDLFGHEITDPKERKAYLDYVLKEKLIEIMLEPLRKLWLKDKEHRDDIEVKAKQLKAGAGASPQALLSLFLLMEEHQIPYKAARYKVSLHSYQEQGELFRMSNAHRNKLKPALSSTQLKRHAHLFANEN